jgi:hypothetical protein
MSTILGGLSRILLRHDVAAACGNMTQFERSDRRHDQRMRHSFPFARLRKHAGICIALAGVALAGACDRHEPPAITLVGIPGQINEHVSIASDGATRVAMVWSASSESDGSNILAAVSEDGGASFGPPVRVNAIDRPARVNGEQPPRVALVPRTDGSRSIVVLWTARDGDRTSLSYAESHDDGRSFGPAASVLSPEVKGNRGWESMVTTRDGRVFILWLDHRDSASTRAAHHAHHHGAPATADAVARAQRSQLFVSALGGSLSPTAIARGVCYCCKTALAAGPDGSVYAAWRHVFAGSHRDIAFTMSREGTAGTFAEPVRVSADGWQIDGCPENGPALAVDDRRRIHVVWPTLVEGERERLQLFHASSADGRTFSSRTPLPSNGNASHPQVIVAPDGSLIAAWDELAAGKRQVQVARGRPSANNEFTFSLLPAADARAGVYPALAATSSGAVLAWAQPREGTQSRIAVTRIAY